MDRFDDFMASCVQYYLNDGLVKYNPVNLGWDKFVEKTSQSIAEYIDNYIKPNDERDISNKEYSAMLHQL